MSSGILITDAEMTTPWDSFPLDLGYPQESPYYWDVIGSYPSPPNILNPWLTHHVPLRPRVEEGVIFAHGWSHVPSEWQDETPVTVKLLLIDQRRNELRFDFEARVDRSLKRKYERQQRERGGVVAWSQRVPLFEREDTEIRDRGRPIPPEARDPISPSPVVVSVGEAYRSLVPWRPARGDRTETRKQGRTIPQQVRGPMSPSPEVVLADKPKKARPPMSRGSRQTNRLGSRGSIENSG